MSWPTPEELHRLQKDYLVAKVAYDYTSAQVVRRAWEEANPKEHGNETFVAKLMEIEEEYHLDEVRQAYQHAKRQLLLAMRELFRRYYPEDEGLQKVLRGIDYILAGNPVAIAHEDEILEMASRLKHPEE